MRKLATFGIVIVLLTMTGIALAFDPIATMSQMSGSSAPSLPSVQTPSSIPQTAASQPAILDRVDTGNQFLPSSQDRPTVQTAPIVHTSVPTYHNAVPQDGGKVAAKLSNIVGSKLPEGVTGSGTRADMKRYQNAIATDHLGNPLMINDKVGLPYFMSIGAVPYITPWTSTKQSSYAFRHGAARYQNPDGSSIDIPLMLVMNQKDFTLWYKSMYSDPQIILP